MSCPTAAAWTIAGLASRTSAGARHVCGARAASANTKIAPQTAVSAHGAPAKVSGALSKLHARPGEAEAPSLA
jgi:hypothetical protein